MKRRKLNKHQHSSLSASELGTLCIQLPLVDVTMIFQMWWVIPSNCEPKNPFILLPPSLLSFFLPFFFLPSSLIKLLCFRCLVTEIRRITNVPEEDQGWGASDSQGAPLCHFGPSLLRC